jgi:hypothetical protein
MVSLDEDISPLRFWTSRSVLTACPDSLIEKRSNLIVLGSDGIGSSLGRLVEVVDLLIELFDLPFQYGYVCTLAVGLAISRKKLLIEALVFVLETVDLLQFRLAR